MSEFQEMRDIVDAGPFELDSDRWWAAEFYIGRISLEHIPIGVKLGLSDTIPQDTMWVDGFHHKSSVTTFDIGVNSDQKLTHVLNAGLEAFLRIEDSLPKDHTLDLVNVLARNRSENRTRERLGESPRYYDVNGEVQSLLDLYRSGVAISTNDTE